MAEHTPIPWQLSAFYRTAESVEGPWDRRAVTITHPAPTPWNPSLEVLVGHLVTASAGVGESVGIQHANAEFIARACNSHDDLLAALEALTEWGRTYTSPLDSNSPHALLIAAVEAIAKAKGGTP